MSGRRLSRRTFLRGAGCALALPLLDAMTPALAADPAPRPRMVFINLHLGFMADRFVPADDGPGYTLSPYLQRIAEHRDDFTVITGTSHPGVNGAHTADVSFLTAAPDAASASFQNTVSVDQIAAEAIGQDTRFPYLSLGLSHNSLSYTRSGANIPAINRAGQLYERLFVTGNRAARARLQAQLDDGRSIIDFVGQSARSLNSRLGPRDRAKLDEYLTNIRQTERRLQESRRWLDVPKPSPSMRKKPKDIADRSDFIAQIELMYDMIHLAVESDSSRVITLNQPNLNDVLPHDGVSQGYHSLSHHNGDAEKIRQLAVVETEQMDGIARLLGKFAATAAGAGSLLDQTQILVGSIFGNANKHDTSNMPIVLAGGGYSHGRHLRFDPHNNAPTANLFVSMLQQAGIPRDTFATSTGTLTGLESHAAAG